MQSILPEIWNKYRILSSFKNELNKKGYVSRDLYCIQIQLDLLKNIIEIESIKIFNELLKKTYYRLLIKINKGIEYLPDIIENPEEYVLNPIEKDREAWIDKDVLIFQTKTNQAVFSKISRKREGFKYLDNKFQ